MQNTIYVLEGSYRNKLIENQSFQLLKAYQPHPHKEGGYITVKIDPKDFPGATSDNYIVSANGTYYVEITDANNCTSESNDILFNETSLTNFDGSIDLSVYPNPFREETTIDFGQIISDATITIVDVYGKLIEKHELKNTDKYIVKGTDKASGVYFMEIQIGEEYLNNIKLVIE